MADTKARIVLTAADETRSAFDSAKRNLADVQGAADKVGGSFGTLGVLIGGVFTGASLKGALDVLDKLDDLAEKSGVAAQELSGLRFASEAAGTPTESLGVGMRKLAQNMAAAAGGSKDAMAIFEAIGVSVKDANGRLRGTDAVLLDIASRFAVYADGAGKAALAQELFGRTGSEMIPLLNKGAAGIRDLQNEANKLGAVYGSDLAKSASDFNDNLKKLELAAEGAKVKLLEQLLPTLNATAEAFLKNAQNGSVFASILKTIGQGVSQRLGMDDVSQLEKLSKAQSDQLTLMGRQIERFDALSKRGVSGAAERLVDLRANFEKLSRAAQATTDQLKGAANVMAPLEAPDALSRKLARGDGLAKPGAPVADKTSDAEAEARRRRSHALSGTDIIAERVGKLLEDSDVVRAKEFADTLDYLNKLYFELGLDADIYDAAIRKLTKSTSTADKVNSEYAQGQKELADMIENSSIGKLDKLQRKMQLLADAYLLGRFGVAGSEEAIKTFGIIANDTLGNIAPEAEKAKSAVERIGEAFEASFTSAIMSGRGLKGVLEQLEQQALSFGLTQIGKELFASATPFISAAIGGIFGGGRAIGGPVTAGTPYIVGERGPEWFVPAGNGNIVPSGAGATVQLVDQRTVVVGDIASKAEVAAMLQRSNRAQVAAIQRSINRGGALG